MEFKNGYFQAWKRPWEKQEFSKGLEKVLDMCYIHMFIYAVKLKE